MKPIQEMTQGELAAFIDSHLQKSGVDVVLSGGACVAIYSDHKYVSKDLDFIVRFNLNKKLLAQAMGELDFNSRGKYFVHPQTPYFVEFIPGPPAVGQDPIDEICVIQMGTGTIRIISPTDSVKDRLAAFYYWGDRQALEQAVLVSNSTEVDMEKIKTWSIREDNQARFEEFFQLHNSK